MNRNRNHESISRLKAVAKPMARTALAAVTVLGPIAEASSAEAASLHASYTKTAIGVGKNILATSNLNMPGEKHIHTKDKKGRGATTGYRIQSLDGSVVLVTEHEKIDGKVSTVDDLHGISQAEGATNKVEGDIKLVHDPKTNKDSWTPTVQTQNPDTGKMVTTSKVFVETVVFEHDLDTGHSVSFESPSIADQIIKTDLSEMNSLTKPTIIAKM